MTYLVAAIEHHARKLAHAVTRAVVEKCSGFSDYEAGDHLQHVHADMLADVEAEYEVGEPSNVDVHLTYMGCGLDMESYATGFNAGYEQAQEHIIADGPPVDMRDITVADRWCGPCGEVHAWRSQTPEAGQPGENPAGVTPQTPAGSPEFCGAHHPSLGWVCTKPAIHRDQHGYAGIFWPNWTTTDPSPTIASRQHQPSVDGEGSPAEIATFPRRPAGERPTWVDWAVPAICDVLTGHTALVPIGDALVHCGGLDGECHSHYGDRELWREHVAGLIAERLYLASKPPLLAAWPETGLDMGARIDGASEFFPQHRTTQK